MGDVTFDVTLRGDRNHRRRVVSPIHSCMCVCVSGRFGGGAYHVDEVSQDTLNLVEVHVVQLHHLHGHHKGIQRKLVSPQQKIPADRRGGQDRT